MTGLMYPRPARRLPRRRARLSLERLEDRSLPDAGLPAQGTQLLLLTRSGEVETVQYHKLTPMLLNELQRLRREFDDQQALIRGRLAVAGWEGPVIADQLPRARTFYFDRVSQIRMPSWTRGRVALVGDAAACPSFLAGQGSALAMVESYVLAAELAAAAGDHVAAFARYEDRLRPFLRSKQDAAVGLGTAFAPRGRVPLLFRNTMMKLMGLPHVANLVMGRSFRDAVELPEAPAVRATPF